MEQPTVPVTANAEVVDSATTQSVEPGSDPAQYEGMQVTENPTDETLGEATPTPDPQPVGDVVDPNVEPANTDEPGAEPAVDTQTVPLEEHIKLRKRAQEAEKRSAYLEGRAEGAQPGQQQKPAGPPPFTPLEEYDGTYEEWVAEKVTHDLEWKNDQKQKMARSSAVDEKYSERCTAAGEQIPDLQETIDTAQLPRFADSIVNAVKKSDLGPQIVYFLAKNPAEATKLAQMDQDVAIMEIGSLREKVKATMQPQKKRVLSSAPSPIVPGNGSGTTVVTDLADKNMGDYAAARDAQRKR